MAALLVNTMLTLYSSHFWKHLLKWHDTVNHLPVSTLGSNFNDFDLTKKQNAHIKLHKKSSLCQSSLGSLESKTVPGVKMVLRPSF